MQKLNGALLIDKVNNYLDNKNCLMEVEILDLRKKQAVLNDFNLKVDLDVISVIVKSFSDFSVLLVKDLNGDVVGVRLISDKDDLSCQVLVFSENEEYIIQNNDSRLVVGVTNKAGQEDAVYAITPNSTTIFSSVLKEISLSEIDKSINNILGYDDTIIYNIHRRSNIKTCNDSCVESDICYCDEKIVDFEKNKAYQIRRNKGN